MTSSNEVARVDAYASATLEERRHYVSAIAQAGELLPKSLWSTPQMGPNGMIPAQPSPAKVLLLAETGSMLGLHPMAALQGIHIIEGKPTLSANLLSAVVRRAGHRLRVMTTGSWDDGSFIARAELVRHDDPEFTYVVEWTKARAERAGLLGKKGPWNSYPEAMAKARAITEVIREGAPDATIVAAYTPEELGAKNVTEGGEVIEAEPVSERAAPRRERSPGLMDLQEPPVSSAPPAQPDPGVGGGFMDAAPAADPNVEDAEIVPPEPAAAEAAPAEDANVVADVAAQDQAGEPLDMQPEAEPAHEHDYAWAAHLASAIESDGFDEYRLRVVYDEAAAAGALGEPVPWGKGNFESTVMAIRANLNAGKDPMDGIA